MRAVAFPLLACAFVLLHMTQTSCTKRPGPVPGAAPEESVGRSPPIIDATIAAEYAASLANEEARRRFNTAPFVPENGEARRTDARWSWSALAGYGLTDLKVTVSFNANRSNPQVDLQQITAVPD